MYTKGEWKIEGQDIIARGKDVINGYICSWSGRTADAQLISASPDLYKALKNLAQEMNYMLTLHPNRKGGLYTRRLKEAQQAINKVEGDNAKPSL